MNDPQALTGQRMCEVISWTLFENELPPEEIWNYSPTGELWDVFFLFGEAEKELSKFGLGPKGASDD